jgi:leucyl aminopeptidase
VDIERSLEQASDSIAARMGIEIDVVASDDLAGDVIAVAVAEPATQLSGQAAQLDGRLGGRLARLAASGELGTDLGEAAVVHVDDGVGAPRVAAAGLGPAEHVDADAFRTAAAAVARAALRFGGTIGWIVDESLPLAPAEQARAIVEGTVLGAYDPAHWKTSNDNRREVVRLVLASSDTGVADAAQRAARVAAWANRARDLANAPPNELTPERLGDRAVEIAAEVAHVQAEALGPEAIDELGMGAFAAVARASHNPPRLVVLRYDPPSAADQSVRLGLVGKAITFDSGGISIKPALHMEDMKGDMAGGAAVVEGLGAIADLGLPVRTIAVVAACENLVGGHAYRPGDILTAASGKTIEVTNTDAEGRLVLADALWYARREGATHLLDLATLTGAMEFALGDLYAGVFANDDDWRERVLEAARRSGDHLWPFPLHPRYRRYVDSSFADLKNSSDLRQASPALAAEFLHEFAGDGPWAHVDMAGPGFLERSRGDYLTQRGGTGYGVRLIVELAQSLSG